mmetsp:Transcript_31105/g.73734  ORF Transcript_31105/g.73734 Transcript_31105/m.73734 type:complete len:248 (-) Transcript_31105:95-838(-)
MPWMNDDADYGKGCDSGKGGGKGKSFKFEVRDPDSTVWLGNLPPNTNFQELQNFMNQVGTCKRAEVLRNGTGFAWFTCAQDAAFAIAKLNGSSFRGSNIVVDVYQKKESSGNAAASSAGKGWRSPGATSRSSDSGVWKPMFQKPPMMKAAPGGKGTQNITGKNKIRNPECTVWLGDLPEGIPFSDVQAHMTQAGECKYVATLRKGTGFAVMGSPDEAANAIALLNGSFLNGATIVVDQWEKKNAIMG